MEPKRKLAGGDIWKPTAGRSGSESSRVGAVGKEGPHVSWGSKYPKQATGVRKSTKGPCHVVPCSGF